MPNRAEAPRDKIEFVRSLWEAADAGGLEAALALTDPEAEWAPHPAGGRVLSTAELLTFLEQYRGERELLRATPYAISAHGGARVTTNDGYLERACSYPSEAEALRAMELIKD
jgi:hypothetical protein